MRLILPCLLLVACGPAAAADLAKVDRSVGKEPKYAGKPKYCLLVFGAEAKHKVWLVADGDTLYVDRDGDGDLTGPNEKIAATKGDVEVAGSHTFEVGELSVGGKTHKGLRVALVPVKWLDENRELSSLPHISAAVKKNPTGLSAMFDLDVECESLKGGGVGGRVSYMVGFFDTAGVLQFGDRPADAPVVHLDGPLQVAFFAAKPTWRGGASQDLILCLGTPGRGPGTFAMVKYEGTIPQGKHPKIQATYRPRKGGEPVKELYELKERC